MTELSDKEFTDMYMRGAKLREIADVMGVTISAVQWRKTCLKLPMRQPSRKAGFDDELTAMFKDGVSPKDIRQHFGLSEVRVRSHIRRLGLKRPVWR